MEPERCCALVTSAHTKPFFDQGRFAFLSEQHFLVGAWGETDDPAVVAAIRELATPTDIGALEARLGTCSSDQPAAMRFDEFIRGYLSNLCGPTARKASVVVRRCFFDGTAFITLGEQEVRSIPLGERPHANAEHHHELRE